MGVDYNSTYYFKTLNWKRRLRASAKCVMHYDSTIDFSKARCIDLNIPFDTISPNSVESLSHSKLYDVTF